MSGFGPVLAIEIPVCTAAGFACIGWLIQRSVRRVDRLVQVQNTQATDLAQIGLRVQVVETTVARLDRAVPTVKEDLAVVAASFDRHERWHERHDPGGHATPA